MKVNADGTYTVTYGTQFDPHPQSSLLKPGGDVSVTITSELNEPNAAVNPKNKKQSGSIWALGLSKGVHLNHVDIQLKGDSYAITAMIGAENQKLRSITAYRTDQIQIDDYRQENDLTVHAATEVTSVRAGGSTINIENCYIRSYVTKGDDFEDGAYLANNGAVGALNEGVWALSM